MSRFDSSDFTFAAQFPKETGQQQLLSLWKTGVKFPQHDVEIDKAKAKGYIDGITYHRALKKPKNASKPTPSTYVSFISISSVIN